MCSWIARRARRKSPQHPRRRRLPPQHRPQHRHRLLLRPLEPQLHKRRHPRPPLPPPRHRILRKWRSRAKHGHGGTRPAAPALAGRRGFSPATSSGSNPMAARSSRAAPRRTSSSSCGTATPRSRGQPPTLKESCADPRLPLDPGNRVLTLEEVTPDGEVRPSADPSSSWCRNRARTSPAMKRRRGRTAHRLPWSFRERTVQPPRRLSSRPPKHRKRRQPRPLPPRLRSLRPRLRLPRRQPALRPPRRPPRRPEPIKAAPPRRPSPRLQPPMRSSAASTNTGDQTTSD